VRWTILKPSAKRGGAIGTRSASTAGDHADRRDPGEHLPHRGATRRAPTVRSPRRATQGSAVTMGIDGAPVSHAPTTGDRNPRRSAPGAARPPRTARSDDTRSRTRPCLRRPRGIDSSTILSPLRPASTRSRRSATADGRPARDQPREDGLGQRLNRECRCIACRSSLARHRLHDGPHRDSRTSRDADHVVGKPEVTWAVAPTPGIPRLDRTPHTRRARPCSSRTTLLPSHSCPASVRPCVTGAFAPATAVFRGRLNPPWSSRNHRSSGRRPSLSWTRSSSASCGLATADRPDAANHDRATGDG